MMVVVLFHTKIVMVVLFSARVSDGGDGVSIKRSDCYGDPEPEEGC